MGCSFHQRKARFHYYFSLSACAFAVVESVGQSGARSSPAPSEDQILKLEGTLLLVPVKIAEKVKALKGMKTHSSLLNLWNTEFIKPYCSYDNIHFRREAKLVFCKNNNEALVTLQCWCLVHIHVVLV